MAHKKKGKAAKNNASSEWGSKSTGQPQKVMEKPAQATKSGHDQQNHKAGNNPAKAPEEFKSPEAQSVITRKEKNSPKEHYFLKISQFLNEVLAEFRKIGWPERSQVIRETVSVLFLVLLITSLVWLFDLIVGKFVFSPLEHWAHMYGIGAGNTLRL